MKFLGTLLLSDPFEPGSSSKLQPLPPRTKELKNERTRAINHMLVGLRDSWVRGGILSLLNHVFAFMLSSAEPTLHIYKQTHTCAFIHTCEHTREKLYVEIVEIVMSKLHCHFMLFLQKIIVKLLNLQG